MAVVLKIAERQRRTLEERTQDESETADLRCPVEGHSLGEPNKEKGERRNHNLLAVAIASREERRSRCSLVVTSKSLEGIS